MYRSSYSTFTLHCIKQSNFTFTLHWSVYFWWNIYDQDMYVKNNDKTKLLIYWSYKKHIITWSSAWNVCNLMWINAFLVLFCFKQTCLLHVKVMLYVYYISPIFLVCLISWLNFCMRIPNNSSRIDMFATLGHIILIQSQQVFALSP
jgi:hypothetical protein